MIRELLGFFIGKQKKYGKDIRVGKLSIIRFSEGWLESFLAVLVDGGRASYYLALPYWVHFSWMGMVGYFSNPN